MSIFEMSNLMKMTIFQMSNFMKISKFHLSNLIMLIFLDVKLEDVKSD